jgi:hypothetical protein
VFTGYKSSITKNRVLLVMSSEKNSGKKIHDSLFKDALSYPGEVEKLIKAYTKPAILAHID